MQAMTILKRCRAAKQDLERLGAQLERRQDAMRAFGGIRLDDVGGGRSAGGDRMAKMSAEIDEIERAIQDRKDAKYAEIGSAIQLIDMLEDELEGSVLHRYYVTGDSCNGIVRALKYDRSYVLRKKREGEADIGKLSEETVAATLPAWYIKKWRESNEEGTGTEPGGTADD